MLAPFAWDSLTAMNFRIRRRIIALAVLFAFALSISLQGLTAAAVAKVVAHESNAAMAMSSIDDPMDCPGPDGIERATCMAACAGFIGILFEAVGLPVLRSHRTHRDERTGSLRDLHIPPDPYPPRPSALI